MGEAKRRKSTMKGDYRYDVSYLNMVADAARRAILETSGIDGVVRLPEVTKALLATVAYFLGPLTNLDAPESTEGFAEATARSLIHYIRSIRAKNARAGLLEEGPFKSRGNVEFDLSLYAKIAEAVRKAVLRVSPIDDGASFVELLELETALLMVLAYFWTPSKHPGTPEQMQAFAESCASDLVDQIQRARMMNVGARYHSRQ
jgi:hypothetical protein